MVEAPSAASEQALLERVNRSAEHAERLLTVLESEAKALPGLQPDALRDLARGKHTLVGELESLGADLVTSLRAAGLDARSDLDDWLAGRTTGPLANALRRLMEAIAACRQLNACNGAAIRLLGHHNSRLLDLLQGQSPSTGLYDHDGRARRATRTRYATTA
jgi:flagellar biosynthesis/type III secretory pathway chaperone